MKMLFPCPKIGKKNKQQNKLRKPKSEIQLQTILDFCKIVFATQNVLVLKIIVKWSTTPLKLSIPNKNWDSCQYHVSGDAKYQP